tara:strand:- start:37 stop:915 length:879 start_codon:yes stop_codon:yes gene_type:complete
MKPFCIVMSALFPFQLFSIVNGSTIHPEFLAEKHAAAISSNFLGSKEFIKLEGTCGGNSSCTIGINGESILTSNGIRISSDRIIGWTMTNASNQGGVLLVGKNEDYRFLIKYFSGSGKRKVSEIGFFNFKSAQSFLGSLELLSGLGANHDQAGATTKCTASGKDEFSGTDNITAASITENRLNRASRKNRLIGGLLGGTTGAVLGDVVGSTTSIATGAVGGGVTGALLGDSLGRTSGSLSLKRNVVSDIRPIPASSQVFFDDSFNYRSDCIDESSNKIKVKMSSPIPVNVPN